MKIAIIGGGISGLATAYFLKKYNPSCHVDLYEKEEKLGGKIKTEYIHGFRIETGTNGFLTNKPEGLELASMINADSLLLESNACSRKRYLFYKNRLNKLPENIKEFISTPILSTTAKLRVGAEYFMPKKKNSNDETLQSFGYRRVGKEFTDKILDAMTAGIFASTPSKLSVNAAFPAVVNLEKEYGSLTRGMIKKKKKEAGPGGVLTSFKDGMSSFIEQLREYSMASIYSNQEITNIEKDKSKWIITSNNEKVDTLYDAIIISTPSYIASRLLKNINTTLSEMLKTIEYTPISIVSLGYNNLPDDSLDGFGLLTERDSNSQALGILWDSSIFQNRAKEKHKLIRVMIGGQRNPLLAVKEEQELVEIAIGAVIQTMNISTKPLLTHVTRWHKGIPNYGLGHMALIESIDQECKKVGNLYLNSNAYKGVSFNDCIKNAKLCAESVLMNSK